LEFFVVGIDLPESQGLDPCKLLRGYFAAMERDVMDAERIGDLTIPKGVIAARTESPADAPMNSAGHLEQIVTRLGQAKGGAHPSGDVIDYRSW
jgi:hypothetical protein